ncbi:hypothetical protein CKA32_000042 [Geitlerinema sp. FC II]|nr:hypothetical protein CKA32_000042 [Geitlerinema sp. FC II]
MTGRFSEASPPPSPPKPHPSQPPLGYRLQQLDRLRKLVSNEFTFLRCTRLNSGKH